MQFVVDASVAAKWVFPEEHSATSRLLLEPEHSRLAPDFLLVELVNIAWQRNRRGSLSAVEARAIVRNFPGYFEPYSIQPLAPTALELSLALGISAYDALYVTLAVISTHPLVTADRRLYDAARARLPNQLIWIEDLPGALSAQ